MPGSHIQCACLQTQISPFYRIASWMGGSSGIGLFCLSDSRPPAQRAGSPPESRRLLRVGTLSLPLDGELPGGRDCAPPISLGLSKGKTLFTYQTGLFLRASSGPPQPTESSLMAEGRQKSLSVSAQDLSPTPTQGPPARGTPEPHPCPEPDSPSAQAEAANRPLKPQSARGIN